MYNHEKYENVPERTLDGLDAWAKSGVPPGDFGRAILTNNLKDTCARADNENQQVIFEIVKYCWNELPSRCWGSGEAYGSWRDYLKEEENEN